MDLVKVYRAARRVSTPILAISTADPAATLETLTRNSGDSPLLRWDFLNGLMPLNKAGEAVRAQVGMADWRNPAETLAVLNGVRPGSNEPVVPVKTVIFMLNGHKLLDPMSLPGNANPAAMLQAIWAVRDTFKATNRTLVLLGPSFTLPPELKHDVMLIDEPLPSVEELTRVVEAEYTNFDLTPGTNDVGRAVAAVRGLSAFAASQAVALSMTKRGLEIDTVWERKRKMIDSRPGIKVWRGGGKFSDLAGLENAKLFLGRYINGKRRPNCVFFIDEIDKDLDTGSEGPGREMFGILLKRMQDSEYEGLVLLGPPGSGKTAIAQAVANEAEILNIEASLAGMKSHYVGDSTQNLKDNLDVVDAVSDKKVLVMATCNSFDKMPPELKRRFTLGTMFFDLPTKKERSGIWKIYEKKYSITPQDYPEDVGWTGAEIKTCCKLADSLECSLIDASKMIVPVAISAADAIEKLRRDAAGRFISASYPGVYQYEQSTYNPQTVTTSSRRILAEDD